MSSEEPVTRKRGGRKQSDEVRARTARAGQKRETSGDRMELVWYEAESWGETKDGIRKLMKTIEGRMSELEVKLKALLAKYDECMRLRSLIRGPREGGE